MKQLILLSLLMAAPCALGVRGGITETQVEMDYEPVVFAVQAINDKFASQGDTQTRTLVEIVRARSQVVAGRKLYLTLHVTGGAVDEFCDVEVVFAPWRAPEGKRLEVVNGPDCSAQRPVSKRIPGGVYAITEVDEYVLKALDFAVDSYNGRSNHAYIFKASVDPKDLLITGQVVAGYKYNFPNLPLTETECRKSEQDDSDFDVEQCDEKKGGKDVTCNVSVIWRDWEEPKYRVFSMSCVE